jgi:hypothetical protein
MFSLPHGNVWDSDHNRLGYRKVCSRWVLKQLSDKQKLERMATCLTNIQRYAAEGDGNET